MNPRVRVFRHEQVILTRDVANLGKVRRAAAVWLIMGWPMLAPLLLELGYR